MKYTQNYNLNQPESNDYYDVAHQNQNMGIIDVQLKEMEKDVTSAKESIETHVEDVANPHGVTAEQIGLGNVENVSTNNQTPTYVSATTLTTLVNGEKLTDAFGKISKAVSELINHIGNKNNPHDVTKEQLGLDNVNNTADANKPVSTAQQEAIDSAYVNANAYTDQKVSEIINNIPSYSENHTHSNKAILDNTTASYTTAEKNKLSGIATGANAYTHPSYTALDCEDIVADSTQLTFGQSFNIPMVTTDSTGHVKAIGSKTHTLPYSEATQSVKGLMSATDKKRLDNITNLIYPIGSIYMSVNGTSPATLFGGIWQQITDRFLVAAGGTFTVSATGGNATHSHSFVHTHGATVTHSHTLSDNGYAQIHHNDSYIWAHEIETETWNDTTKIGNISGKTQTTGTSTSGVVLGGATDETTVDITTSSQSSTSTVSASNLPPYLAVYMWKRTA